MEIWKDIKGYEGLYQISNLGNVKKLETVTVTKSGYKQVYKEKIMALVVRKGYYTIWLRKDGVRKSHAVHRLVYEAFVGDIPNDMVVDHIDCNKLNNNVNNLDCVSQQENVVRAIQNGLHKNWNNQHTKKIS